MITVVCAGCGMIVRFRGHYYGPGIYWTKDGELMYACSIDCSERVEIWEKQNASNDVRQMRS